MLRKLGCATLHSHEVLIVSGREQYDTPISEHLEESEEVSSSKRESYGLTLTCDKLWVQG
eukprot:5201278-Amphidinium_carterae.2